MKINDEHSKNLKIIEKDGSIILYLHYHTTVNNPDEGKGYMENTQSFKKIFRLPNDAIKDSARAKYSKGTLTIRVAKDMTNTRNITIEESENPIM